MITNHSSIDKDNIYTENLHLLTTNYLASKYKCLLNAAAAVLCIPPSKLIICIFSKLFQKSRLYIGSFDYESERIYSL